MYSGGIQSQTANVIRDGFISTVYLSLFDGSDKDYNYRGIGNSGASIYITSGDAAPTAGDGTWEKGDIVINSSPDPTEWIGWVCTTAGDPNDFVWKGFGVIEN